MHRVSIPYIVSLTVYSIGLALMWNGLHIIVLPAVLLNFVPGSQKNTYLGLLTFLGLILALVIQPVSGALSDRWVSRWGRRRPLVAIGTAIDLLFLGLLAWAGGLWALFIGYAGLQISSNIAQGPAQGLLPDQVPPEQLGLACGVKNLMDMLGLVLATLVVGRIVAPDEKRPVVAMSLIALALLTTTAITIASAREEPTQEQTSEVFGDFRSLVHLHTGYWWLIGSRFLYLLGVYGVQVFAQYFVRDRLDVPNPVQTTGDLLATIVIALMIFALGAGWLSDKWGRRRVQALAGIVGALGVLMLTIVQTPTQLFLYGSIIGAGLGIFLSANWALANGLAPPEEAGKFLGLTNLATAGAAAAGRLEGPLIDLLNNAWPGQWWGYTALFTLGAACMLASTALLVEVPES